MSLLAALKPSESKIEEFDVTIIGVKPAGEMRWDKDTKTHVARKEKSADTLVTFRTPEGATHMLSCYKADAFSKGVYPQIGAKGIKGTISLKANKVAGQQPNLVNVRFDFDEVSGLQARMLELTAESFD